MDVPLQQAVVDQAAWTDTAAITDGVAAAEMRLGLDDHIAAKACVLREGAAGWVDETHTCRHPLLAQTLLQHPFALGQLSAVVDASDLREIGDDLVAC